MKFDHPLLQKLGGLLGSAAVRAWMSTLDYKAAYYDPSIDPAREDYEGQKIYVFWHEYILFPLYLRGHCDLAMLLSQHRDAEILSHVAYHLGFEFVRGSSNRGSVTALRKMLAKSRDMNLTITPDGPRGPRRQFALGAIFLASKLQMPLVLTGYGFDRPWRAHSWDRFAIPRLGSRARAVVTPGILIPPDLDRAGLEHFRQRIETLLNWASDEAERWATSGQRKPEQLPVHKATRPWPRSRKR